MIQSLSTCAVTLAPSATISTTFDPDSELTWGCSPGTNCDPPKPGLCEVWVDSPVDQFVCPADYCQSVKTLALGGANEAGKFPLSEGYFDLDPYKFGLDFNVFIKTASTVDTRSLPQQRSNTTNDSYSYPDEIARRIDTGVIPAACFDTCNNAYLEAQSTGKGPGLCRPDSAFMIYYLGCDYCVDKNIEQTTGISSFITSSSYLSSKFSQFLRYCKISGDVNVGLAPVGDQPAGASASTSLGEGTTISTADAVVDTSPVVTSTMGTPTVDNPTVGTPPPEISSTRATSGRQATANDSVGSLSSVAGSSTTESSTAASSTADLSTTEATVSTEQTPKLAASSAVSSEKEEASSSADRTTRWFREDEPWDEHIDRIQCLSDHQQADSASGGRFCPDAQVG
ncbi:hypothetical protein Daus18300_014328 [Diaporthe australafricana]|uniref:Uncharacterized protein n=1 Tax=Diaporthe australafricana TaxID=127596 RepID=A0ABR3VVM1_9PEZI